MNQEQSGNPQDKISVPDIDLVPLSFPSDALSVKRLRALFPQRFDGPGYFADGYDNCDFFLPVDEGEPCNLLLLNDLLRYERVIAAVGFYSQFVDTASFREDQLFAINAAEKNLMANYVHFRLADGPETARFLIEQVRAEGVKQAQACKSRGR